MVAFCLTVLQICSPTHTRKQKQCILCSLFDHFKGPNNTLKKKRNKLNLFLLHIDGVA